MQQSEPAQSHHTATIYLVCPFPHQPCIHYAHNSTQDWQTIPLTHHHSNIYKTSIIFTHLFRFVFCSSDKKTWLNPDEALSSPESWVRQGKPYNWRVREEGDYVVVNRCLERVRKVGKQQDAGGRGMLVINADGVLCGEEVSLLQFNRVFMREFYFDRQFVLVYTTGRTLQKLFSQQQSLILPQYVISESGSRIHQLYSPQPFSPTYPKPQLFQPLFHSNIPQPKLHLLHSTLSHYPSLHLDLSPGKISFYLTSKQFSGDFDRFCILSQTLREHQLEVNFVSRNNIKYVDVTDQKVDKATSLMKVIELEVPRRVVGFGSAVSDSRVLEVCDEKVVPCNVNRETMEVLRRVEGVRVSTGEFADCVSQFLEGEWWRGREEEESNGGNNGGNNGQNNGGNVNKL